MKNLRYLLVGIMVGGAVGAKLGAYFSSVLNPSNGFQLIESGMIYGALVGLISSIALLVAITSTPSKIKSTYINNMHQ
jgi:hypothetical protein